MSVDSFGYLIEKSTRLGTIYFWRTSLLHQDRKSRCSGRHAKAFPVHGVIEEIEEIEKGSKTVLRFVLHSDKRKVSQ